MDQAFANRGAQSTDHEITGFANFQGARGQGRGDSVGAMSSGDKVFVSNQGTITFGKDGTGAETGTWSFSGGAGSSKG